VQDAFTVCNSMSEHIEDVAASCHDLAKSCSDFADGIDKAHHDVEDVAEDTKTAAVDGMTKDALAHSAQAVPQGLTAEQFTSASQALRAGAGPYGGELVVQGSRAAGTAGPASDIDFAIRQSRAVQGIGVRAIRIAKSGQRQVPNYGTCNRDG
jgi:hypothetical protein